MHAIRFFWIGIAALQGVAAVRGGDALPLVFVPNRGQAHGDVRFVAKGARLNAYFSAREALFQMQRRLAADRIYRRAGAAADRSHRTVVRNRQFPGGPGRDVANRRAAPRRRGIPRPVPRHRYDLPAGAVPT